MVVVFFLCLDFIYSRMFSLSEFQDRRVNLLLSLVRKFKRVISIFVFDSHAYV